MMKKYYSVTVFVLTFCNVIWAQNNDSIVYQKKALEATEISFISGFYTQKGVHSAVGGGIGTEKLTDISPQITVNIPTGTNGVLNGEFGVSAYSSASSSNINPFDISQASGNGPRRDDDDDSDNDGRLASPWIESSGPSGQDIRVHGNLGYSHYSQDRNRIWNVNGSSSAEYDYMSFGLGGGFTALFNDKNSEFSIKASVYMDQWKPIYATELKSYRDVNGNLNEGFFAGIPIIRSNVVESSLVYNPEKFTFADTKNRNTFFTSLSFSQIVTENFQFSVFGDVVFMNELLATPYHRVYFADKNDYYIEDFQLADDREKLPDTRFKLPIGARFHYYLSDTFILRTYYRYYWDDWGISAHTLMAELPIKLSDWLTIYPVYRFYTQTQAKYFYENNVALSSYEFYTSDYDLSAFDSHQYGAGIRIAPPLGITKGALRLKSIDLRYNSYSRSDGLDASIVSFGLDFAL